MRPSVVYKTIRFQATASGVCFALPLTVTMPAPHRQVFEKVMLKLLQGYAISNPNRCMEYNLLIS